MTVSYFVRYEGAAAEDFVRRYREEHVPILARWPGMRRVVLHTPLPSSPERLEARRDFEAFPAHEGDVSHQAMSSEEVWRKR